MRSVLATACAFLGAGALAAPDAVCVAKSAATLTPVVEVYTSEGCSSCPPADKWLSALKDDVAKGRVVAQGFHVGYWDYIGWVDRFANPLYTQRQRKVASWNGISSIYTPQIVRNGQDWRDERVLLSPEPARASIELRRTADDAFAASVAPADGVGSWGAYWTVTENGHSSKVKSGENTGEFLKHDFVVRQYVSAGDHRGAGALTLRTIAATAGHPRQVNLVVFDPKSGKTLQALSLNCGA
ncbi:MAG TPA: DUF1223 domain-containing protein [Ramlibacter sp.]|nr:DUF1223 domain-containing protein [Ramlibacter sp.]